MNKLLFIICLFLLLGYPFTKLQSQNKIPFGGISKEDLENKPYPQDPGADAIVLSDIGIAALNYSGSEFYIELVRDVKIRIVNTNGFDYANIELPFSSNDKLIEYKASTFNLQNGTPTEEKIPKKSFILTNETPVKRVLRFTFPDVHEGSVIEYSYKVDLRNTINILYPWQFQFEIPVVLSSFSVAYPEYFVYRNFISGSATSVTINNSSKDDHFGGRPVKINIKSYVVTNMSAFKEEPYIKSSYENLTRIDFELASVNFPGTFIEEITPSYKNLSSKLLDRNDFGVALKNTRFLKQKAVEITSGLNDDLSKLKKIHEYVSKKILWNGIEDYTSSASLKSVFSKEKGNSADVNFILIGMLRAVNIKADPVILCTRSNGSINKNIALIQKFNYVVANVQIGNGSFLVDATDPVRPFNLLPLECVNDAGYLVGDNSRFIDLRNNEKNTTKTNIHYKADVSGDISGDLSIRHSGMDAYNTRKLIKLAGKERYTDRLKEASTEIKISDYEIGNLDSRDSDMIESVIFEGKDIAQVAGRKILLNPFLSPVTEKNPFYEVSRKFPVDLGVPIDNDLKISIVIPDGYSVAEKPGDAVFSLGKNDGKFEFKCEVKNRTVEISCLFKIDKTVFQPGEYASLRDFYTRMLNKQSELIVLTPNTFN